MAATASSLSELLPALTFSFLLVVCRIGAAVAFLPGLGEAEIPATTKAAIVLALAALLWPALEAGLPPPPGDPARAVSLVAGECVIGFWIGLLARMIVLSFAMAAQYLGLLLGLSAAVLFDPAFGVAGTSLSRLMGVGAVVVLFASGLHVVPIAALAGSYRLFPPGGGVPTEAAVESVVAATSGSLALAFALAAPFVVASVVFQLALALLSRLVPQMQVFFVALPLQLAAGLALLAALAGTMTGVWLGAVRAVFDGLPGL